MVLIKPFLEELSSKLSLKNKVIFLGFVSELEKLELLNLADIYVLASLREGLPFSLLEAMSTDCICLATPVGDVGRVVVEKQNGFLLEPMNPEFIARKMMEVLSLSDENITLIRNQTRKTILDNYDFKVIVKQMIGAILDDMQQISQ